MKKPFYIILCISLLLLGKGCAKAYNFPQGAEGYWYAPGYGVILKIRHGNGF